MAFPQHPAPCIICTTITDTHVPTQGGLVPLCLNCSPYTWFVGLHRELDALTARCARLEAENRELRRRNTALLLQAPEVAA